MKVLIIGFACLPGTGGETSHTWNWAWHLSRLHEVWVLTCPGDRPIAQPSLGETLDSHLRIHWLAVPHWLNERNPLGGSAGLVINYLRWLKLAYVKALELHEQIGFDIVHHVSFSSISAPPPFWKLPIPFVWGPIGGAQRVPHAFRKYVSSFSLGEILRSSRLALLPSSLPLHRIARSGTTVLTTNRETYDLLRNVGARNVSLFLDSGIPSSLLSVPQITRSTGRPFTILWVGRMEPRKALPLALEALRETNGLRVNLLIAGDGSMRRKWESYAYRLNLGDKVKFLGQIPWNEMSHLYQSADAFLFTSLRDSFGTQVLEAMGHGLPILTLDHQGVGTFVPSDAGIKVPITYPLETVKGIAEGIRRLALFPEERQRMGEAGRAYARTETWERRAERMSQLYEKARARTLVHPSFRVLGVRVDSVQIADVVGQMKEWIREKRGCHSVAATGMHGIVEAQHDPGFKRVLNNTDLIVPDGAPLVWVGRRRGHDLPRRVYGPDLVLAFCEVTQGQGYRHFFYGGEPGVPAEVAASLKHRFPRIQVAGIYSPPFRPLSREEDGGIVAMISRAAPDVLWVGLGAPKQERWMQEHRSKLNVPVVVGVGAAFDMISGRRRQAPRWVRENGFEWLFRLLQEPRRLWRRYLIYGTQFVAWIILESLRLKNFEPNASESKAQPNTLP